MAISDTRPAERYTSNGKTVFPFNIVETEVTDPETVGFVFAIISL